MNIRTTYTLPIACGALLLAAGVFFAQSGGREEDNDRDMAPHGKGIGTMHSPGQPGTHFGPARTARGGGGANGISYHGGPIITGTTNIYIIWYGTWSPGSQSIITTWANGIGGSTYFNINTTYTNSANTHVTNAVHFGGSTADAYSQGTTLTDTTVQTVVSTAISNGSLPLDTNAVYFVLTSADVNESSGFCTQYCGWHWYGTIKNANIKYAFVGNPARCPSACTAQSSVSPNGDVGADGVVSITSHELEEAVTDANGNAWYDSRGNENADKCAWTFGATSAAANGSKYNMVLGGRDFLIQQNWVNAGGGYCALKY